MDQETRIKALALHLGCDKEEISESRYDEKVLEVYGDEYLVVDDEEADEAATDYIRESLWAFNASFLAGYTDLPEEVFQALSQKCENSNDAILTIVERTEGGLDGLVKEAISADGRGHFLSSYDGKEREVWLEEEEIFAYIYQR